MEGGEGEREIKEREGRGQIYMYVHVGGESSLIHRLASLEIREGDWGFLYQFCSTCLCLSPMRSLKQKHVGVIVCTLQLCEI